MVLIDKERLAAAIADAKRNVPRVKMSQIGNAAGFECERAWHRFRAKPKTIALRRVRALADELRCDVSDLVVQDGGPAVTSTFDDVAKAWPVPLHQVGGAFKFAEAMFIANSHDIESPSDDVIASCSAELIMAASTQLRRIAQTQEGIVEHAKALVPVMARLEEDGFKVVLGRYIKRRPCELGDQSDVCDAVRCLVVAIRREPDPGFTVDRRNEPPYLSNSEDISREYGDVGFYLDWEERLPMLW